MTLYSACCAPLSANDDRKPEFVGYADFHALEEERDALKVRAEKAEECERKLREVASQLIEAAIF